MAIVNVGIFKRKNSNNYQMRWIDPDSGRVKWESTKTNIKRDAERVRDQTEREINEGTYYKIVKTVWPAFRERYETAWQRV